MDRVFDGRVFAVEAGLHRYPDGTEHHVAIVRHRPSVVIIPLLDDGRVLLVEQYRPSLERRLWELPAGSTEPDERADGAAIRECAEETGHVPSRVERLAALYPAPGFCDEQLIFFRATGLSRLEPGSSFRPDADEDIEVRPVTLADARAMLARGEIVDLKTAYGLSLA
jgi:ADP-ribose pyrophosphatase